GRAPRAACDRPGRRGWGRRGGRRGSLPAGRRPDAGHGDRWVGTGRPARPYRSLSSWKQIRSRRPSTAPASLCGRAQGSLPGAALSFRVAEEAYRPIWRIAGPSSQLCIVRGTRRRPVPGPARGPPACPVRSASGRYSVLRLSPPSRRARRPEHPEAPRESASRPEGHDRVVTRAPIWHSVEEVPADLGPTAVSIGNYDG